MPVQSYGPMTTGGTSDSECYAGADPDKCFRMQRCPKLSMSFTYIPDLVTDKNIAEVQKNFSFLAKAVKDDWIENGGTSYYVGVGNYLVAIHRSWGPCDDQSSKGAHQGIGGDRSGEDQAV